MHKYVRCLVVTKQNNDIEFDIRAEYSLSKEYDDFRKWEEISIEEVEINDLIKQDADKILDEGISKMHMGDFLDNNYEVEYFFGSIDKFIEELENENTN